MNAPIARRRLYIRARPVALPIGCTMLTAGEGECRYIADAPDGAETRFCGRPVARGTYCRKHAAACYRRAEPHGEASPW